MLKRTTYTKTTSAKLLHPKVIVVDAKGKVLGRLATQVAQILQGKDKVNYSPNMVGGDVVVVTNAAHVEVTGRKAEQKMYSNYSGYPGGLREENYARLHERRPQEVVRHAISGMLPDNKLRDVLLARLFVVPAETYILPPKTLEILQKIDGATKE